MLSTEETARPRRRAVPRRRMLAGASALAVATVLAAPGVAHADASHCGHNGISGETCTYVIGRGLQVNAIKVRVIVGKRILGHFQMFGTSFNINTADRVYEGTGITGYSWIDSGWHYPNKQVADGSYVCGRFWQKIGTRYQGFGPIECVKAHR